MSDDLNEDAMACRGCAVLEAWHEMAECRACGKAVRWDLQDDRLWGFKATCKHAVRVSADAAVERVRGRV